MKRIWRWFKGKIVAIARIDSTPVKIAVGIGLGAFIAMFPITGFQFLTGLLLSFLFRVNKVAVVITTQIVCNPLTMPFLFFLDYKVGEKILGLQSSVTIQSIKLLLSEVNVTNFLSVLGAIAKPLYLGSSVTAPIVGMIGFTVGFFLVRTFKRRKQSGSNTVNAPFSEG